MNWLAHLHLSDPSPASRIGNLLPDLLKARELMTVPDEFIPGIRQHRIIDAFTDAHPVFRVGKRRIDGTLGRFSPILVDMFYDHFLARDWASYSDVPLDEFVASFHASIEGFRHRLPAAAYARLTQIREGGWLGSYREPEGVRIALMRTGQRLRRPLDLGEGVKFLMRHYEEFAADFGLFYPQLITHVANRSRG